MTGTYVICHIPIVESIEKVNGCSKWLYTIYFQWILYMHMTGTHVTCHIPIVEYMEKVNRCPKDNDLRNILKNFR